MSIHSGQADRLMWGEARVYIHDAAGALVHLPAHWTDAVPADPFVVIAAGRAYVRLEDLLHLRALLDAALVAPEGTSTC
jgi:hypothetical protein